MNTNHAVCFGAAFGDALAAPFEFRRDVDAFAVPDTLPARARVTDDTQMLLAVGEALAKAGLPVAPEPATRALIDEFVTWSRSPENNRAPGNTCMAACRALGAGRAWTQASQMGSKGCGANMRVQPVALLHGLDSAERCGLAQLQAALTHGHPTALAAADLTAEAIHALASGVAPDALPAHLRAYARSQRRIHHGAWLGDLWRRSGAATPEDYVAAGWDECLGALDRLETGLRAGDRSGDPCLVTGEGWVAEEALATGLLCFLLFPDDPRAALHRAVRTAGDSDSIACLTGAFVGAAHGPAAFPDDWYGRIEYAPRLHAVADAMAHLSVYSTRKLPPFAFHRLSENLWSGRNPLTVRDVRTLAEAGVTHVLDLREEREWTDPGRHGADAVAAMAPAGLVRRHVPVRDQSAPSRAAFDAAWAFAQEVLDVPGTRLYVHCRAGRERTAAVVGALHARQRGISFNDALRELDRGRDILDPLPGQTEAARRWCG